MTTKNFGMVVAGLVLAGTVIAPASSVEAAHRKRVLTARLHGYNEVPSISTAGHGRLWMRVSRDEHVIEYKLTVAGLSTPVTQAHIHFGEPHTNGGVSVFLCQTAAKPDPAGLAPMCVDEGTVEGTLTAEQVIGPADQGLAPGQIRELVRALRARAAYVNVHTERVASGEIRGQIR